MSAATDTGETHPLDESLAAFRHLAFVASMHFDAWRTLRPESFSAEIHNAHDRYGFYFNVAVEAHFSQAIVLTHQLFDDSKQHPGTVSFREVHRRMREVVSLLDPVRQSCTSEWRAARRIHAKVQILRNQWMAHRAIGVHETDVFAAARLTPNDLRDQIERAKRLHNLIVDAIGRPAFNFYHETDRDLQRLLKDLRRLPAGPFGFFG